MKLEGIRVLDLTRVLAGPTCARALAEHGADVLRITGAHLPSLGYQELDTGHGKLSANLDLRDQSNVDLLRGLAALVGWKRIEVPGGTDLRNDSGTSCHGSPYFVPPLLPAGVTLSCAATTATRATMTTARLLCSGYGHGRQRLAN